jgi:AraC-like DNA-binding protein
MSTATLKKKLGAEGTAFEEILEETRHELANKYISEAKLSREEISFLLGFSDPNQFANALNKWQSATPLES